MGVAKTIGSLFSVGVSTLKSVTAFGSTVFNGANKILSSKVVKVLGGALIGTSIVNIIKSSSAGKASAEAIATNTPARSEATTGSSDFFESMKKSIQTSISGTASLFKGLVDKTVSAAESMKNDLNIKDYDDEKTEQSAVKTEGEKTAEKSEVTGPDFD